MRRKRDGGRERVEFWGVKAREGEEERERVAVESFKEGRRGVFRRAENQPRRQVEEEEGGGGGRGRWDGRERKEVMVATRSEAAEAVVGWSERGFEVETAAWPKR